jgi:hypothetical protein
MQCRLFDFFRDAINSEVVMELCDFGNLRSLIIQEKRERHLQAAHPRSRRSARPSSAPLLNFSNTTQNASEIFRGVRR